nr:oleate hydratase [Kitasatospora azatica]
MTFKDSPWLMSIVVPRPPHFDGQPDDVFTLWGYGLFIDTPASTPARPWPSAPGRRSSANSWASSASRPSPTRSAPPRP